MRVAQRVQVTARKGPGAMVPGLAGSWEFFHGPGCGGAAGRAGVFGPEMGMDGDELTQRAGCKGIFPVARRDAPRASASFGFSLVEVLLSMTILSVLVLVLAELLAFSAKMWSRHADGAEVELELREGAAVLRHDLESCFAGRPAPWAGSVLPSASGPHLPAGSELACEKLFRHRLLLPVEVDRTAGKGQRVSLPHAEAAEVDGRPVFSTLAFAAVQSEAGLLHPCSLHRQRSGGSAPLGTEPIPAGGIALVAYYVAYTRNSPLAGETGWSMKLYRHYRPAGFSLGVGQAGGILRAAAQAVNREQVPRGQLANRDLSFLLAWRAPRAGSEAVVAAERPWPAWSDTRPPGRAPAWDDLSLWADSESLLYDFLAPDVPLVQNVVRFQVRPFKWVDVGGKLKRLDTRELVAFLKLPDPDWPVLVVPDEVEVILSVISSTAASQLPEKRDWMASWREDRVEAPDPVVARILRRSVRTCRFRVSLPSAA